MLLLPSTTTPNGFLKRAAAPSPSAHPLCPAWPATVVTRPSVVVTFRIQQLFRSLTTRFPSMSRASPHGMLKRAVGPDASAKPASPPTPASVVTLADTPSLSITCRRQWFWESATNMV
eukprot:CAMPEP_0179492570 /NCGR_PEP_ID=MMETSP0799-20121207/66850_1 /TAXON_ID=46947 /ORGANISM="Geminigera cryophila, Strain CCMP2564" /LENGTH=117 /DNA_ID=CAMNT_0021309413 /DNA_START=419 /DNA_END=769 /DNA_ORIENTATION=-